MKKNSFAWSVNYRKYVIYTDEKYVLSEFSSNEEILMLLDLGIAAEGTEPLPNHNSRKDLSETVTYL